MTKKTMRGLALIVVDKKWAELVKARRVFADGHEPTEETISFVVRILSRDQAFGLLAEGLEGLGKRECPLRILIPWNVISAVIDAEIFEKPGLSGVAAFGFIDVSPAMPKAANKKRLNPTK